MILGNVSYLDCTIFVLFLIPQLLLNVRFFELLACIGQTLPFLAFRLPYEVIRERWFLRRRNQTPFVRHATPFQDFVVRCVRFAFARIPAKIGRVFFSKYVALPFLRFRMLRHGIIRTPVHWQEVKFHSFKGIWINDNIHEKPGIVVYYCHGGGFSMGSTYFYLEFLMVWVSLLKAAGYHNPALFALEYTLVPDAVYPTQLKETIAGYDHVLSVIDDPSRVCVAGDSAGGTLILSLLLMLGQSEGLEGKRPGFAVLISPWVTLVSAKNRNTPSDYLNVESLHFYARQYVGAEDLLEDPIVSPGKCGDIDLWSKSTPTGGVLVMFGSEEAFGGEIRDLIPRLRKAGTWVATEEKQDSIHAWPVAALFLGERKDERLQGLREIATIMKERMGY